jgi:hypothetical protein
MVSPDYAIPFPGTPDKQLPETRSQSPGKLQKSPHVSENSLPQISKQALHATSFLKTTEYTEYTEKEGIKKQL